MGQEAEQKEREKAFAGYCLDDALLGLAKPDCLVLHCLPAHRGEEISDAVIEGHTLGGLGRGGEPAPHPKGNHGNS